MADTGKTRNQLDGEIIKLRRGLAIYKVNLSPFYRVRMRDPRTKKYVVRSTKETTRIDARTAAEEHFEKFMNANAVHAVPKNFTFEFFADRLINREKTDGVAGLLHLRLYKNTSFYLRHKTWGAVDYFRNRDIRTITTRDYNEYMSEVREKDGDLRPTTFNHISSAFAKVMKTARDAGAIDAVIATPRTKRKDNPRSFFRFTPLVSRDQDEYQKLLVSAAKMAEEGTIVRETKVTEELRDMVLFLTHSFLRPTESEFYQVRHRDVMIVKDPRGLQITIDKGKTGQRITSTMPACVEVYKRICNRNAGFKPDDFIFFAEYDNRSSAKRIAQRLFNALLDHSGLKEDVRNKGKHSLYSLRHTAICMRLVNSKGKVNIYTLAKNAGTSVSQIERFYAKALPISTDLVRNLQSFGD